MSLVEFPIKHFIVAIDQQGLKKGKFRVEAQSDGISSLTADQLSDAFLAAFQAVSDLKVVEYGYTTTSKETDLTPPPGTAGEQKAIISVVLDRQSPPLPGQDVFGTINIPGPSNDLFLAPEGEGNTIIDVNNADLLTYLDLFTAGLILPGFVISDFQHISDPSVPGNISGKRGTRGSKKG